ncbi:MAG: efflux RND transporter periplasmic adaptor subunit [Alphaproteobacteria bacterium]|nr:efflux RND transporter periplasmic adaptor subunit [Alphaproteobacteria bacterium]
MDQGPAPGTGAKVTPRRSRTRGRILGTFLVLAAVAGIAAGAWWLAQRPAEMRTGPGFGGPGGPGGPPGGPGSFRRAAATVGVAPATKADIPIIIDALGTVTPAATVTARPQVSGVISEIRYREGETVQKDQLLVVLDPRPFQLALDVAQGNLARDEAQLQNAQVTLERYRTLLTQNSIARQEVDTQAATVRQLQGTIAANRAAVDTARLNLTYSRITAPITGRIGLRPVDVGNYVSTGDTAGVAVINQVVPIDVVFSVPEDDVPRIEQRVARGATPDVTALDRARTTTLGQGKFQTLDNLIDTTTGTVKAKARFDNRAGTLFPGQFVNIRIQLDVIQGAIVVPVAALRHGTEGDYTYVLQEDSTVKIRPVRRGPTVGDSVSIAEGIAEGERVVTEGGDRLTDGQAVQLPGQGQGQRRGQRPTQAP